MLSTSAPNILLLSIHLHSGFPTSRAPLSARLIVEIIESRPQNRRIRNRLIIQPASPRARPTAGFDVERRAQAATIQLALRQAPRLNDVEDCVVVERVGAVLTPGIADLGQDPDGYYRGGGGDGHGGGGIGGGGGFELGDLEGGGCGRGDCGGGCRDGDLRAGDALGLRCGGGAGRGRYDAAACAGDAGGGEDGKGHWKGATIGLSVASLVDG